MIEESDLAEFAKFFRREHPYQHMGGSLTTYPQAGEDESKKHEICKELERRGTVKRAKVAYVLDMAEQYVVWKGTEPTGGS